MATDDIKIIAAFDMRDPAQVAALHSLLQFTPVEKAQQRVGAAQTAVKEWAARHLTTDQRVGLLLSRDVPGLSDERAAELSALHAAVDAARAALANVKSAAALVATRKAA